MRMHGGGCMFEVPAGLAMVGEGVREGVGGRDEPEALPERLGRLRLDGLGGVLERATKLGGAEAHARLFERRRGVG